MDTHIARRRSASVNKQRQRGTKSGAMQCNALCCRAKLLEHRCAFTVSGEGVQRAFTNEAQLYRMYQASAWQSGKYTSYCAIKTFTHFSRLHQDCKPTSIAHQNMPTSRPNSQLLNQYIGISILLASETVRVQ
eukprot:12774-Heterococcus_DN1.PRE.2